MRFVALLLSLFFALSCAGVPPPRIDRTCKPRYVSHTYHVDSAFTSAERVQLRLAVSDWRAFSSGQVFDFLVFDGDLEAEAAIVRVESTMPIVLTQDRELTRQRGSPQTHLGWAAGTRVSLVADRVGPALRYIAVHELGHAAGLPHSDDTDAIMASRYAGVQEFHAGDLEVCRAACLCP